jgi:hypothetical protein
MTILREDIVKLREQGKTREEMAEILDVSLSTVRRLIRVYGVPRPSKNARRTRESRISRFGEIIGDPGNGLTLLEQAIDILEDRFQERRGYGYYLDGRPASVDKIIDAAGLKQGKI